MSKAGKRLIESAKQALAFAEGTADPSEYRVTIPDDIDVKRIRETLNMSQSEFAEHFGFSVRTLQDWEQGRRVPSGVAKNFLILLQRAPDMVRETLLAVEAAEDLARTEQPQDMHSPR
ncbi:MAG: helix-turn-helix domain-containing protein [Anaerolineae bacterium]|nr:helix-turn-helix domain-containing protein [Anaerolineae bacterium]